MARYRKDYVIRYFIVWPPPHPGFKGARKRDRAMWYWNDLIRAWGEKLDVCGYKTRKEAEDVAFVAATLVTKKSPGVEQIGKVRTSRQLVGLVSEA